MFIVGTYVVRLKSKLLGLTDKYMQPGGINEPGAKMIRWAILGSYV